MADDERSGSPAPSSSPDGDPSRPGDEPRRLRQLDDGESPQGGVHPRLPVRPTAATGGESDPRRCARGSSPRPSTRSASCGRCKRTSSATRRRSVSSPKRPTCPATCTEPRRIRGPAVGVRSRFALLVLVTAASLAFGYFGPGGRRGTRRARPPIAEPLLAEGDAARERERRRRRRDRDRARRRVARGGASRRRPDLRSRAAKPRGRRAGQRRELEGRDRAPRARLVVSSPATISIAPTCRRC